MSIRNVNSSREADYLTAFNRQQNLRQQQRLQNKEADEKRLDLFNHQESAALQTEQKDTRIFDNYIKGEYPGSLPDVSVNQVIQETFTSYVGVKELAVLFEFFDNKAFSKKKLDDLRDELLEADEESASQVLDQFFKSNNFNLAEIYAVLTYLQAEIAQKKQKKDKLLTLINKLLAKMSQQNSAYLNEFFSLVNHPAVKNSPELADNLANLSAGSISSGTVRDTLKIVSGYLKEQESGIVSSCIRLRFHIVSALTKEILSFEDKSKLSEYLNFEKNLLVINTMQVRLRNFRNVIAESKVWNVNLSEDYSALIEAILNFVDVPMVTEHAVRSLISGLGARSTATQLIGFRNKVGQLLRTMPLEVFNNQEVKMQKVMQSYFKLVSDKGQANSQDEIKFDFIKRGNKVPIKYI